MKGANKGLILLGVLVLVFIAGAIFLRGRGPVPENPDLPSVAIESQ